MEFNATFLVAFISFIIFIIIMNQILYKPVCGIIDKRKKLIDGNYNSARANKKKSEAILQERLDKLKNAMGRVKEKTTEELGKVKEENLKLEQEAKEESKIKIEQNLNALNEDKNSAISALKGDVINLAQIISDKFIESDEKITDIDNETIEKIMQD